jgi:hypothetical protein
MARQKRPGRTIIKTTAEPLRLGRIEIRLFGRKQYAGAVVISGSGIRWYPARAKRPRQVTWSELTTLEE